MSSKINLRELLAEERARADIPEELQKELWSGVTKGLSGAMPSVGEGEAQTRNDEARANVSADAPMDRASVSPLQPLARASRGFHFISACIGAVCGLGIGVGATLWLVKPTAQSPKREVNVAISGANDSRAAEGLRTKVPKEPKPLLSTAPVLGDPNPRVPDVSPKDHSSTDTDTNLQREITLLETARSAVLRADSQSALEALASHEREFPRGKMVEEREVLAVQALVRGGQANVAAERAARFRLAHPTSPLLPALDAALQRP